MSRELYLLPEQGKEMLWWLLADISSARSRVIMVSFLPPDITITSALTRARASLGEAVQVILDGSTQTSAGRIAIPWADVRLLEAGGTIHAKMLVVDDVVWWGSWNFSRSAVRQIDAVERIDDPLLLVRFLGWIQEIRSLSKPADPTEAPRGPYKGSPEQGPVNVKDPDLGW